MPKRQRRLERLILKNMQNYHDLLVYQKAFEFVKLIYAITKKFPKEETFGLTSQLRRVSVSVIENIAEGRGKSTDADFLRFLFISKGSLNECQCYIELAEALGFITKEQRQSIEKKHGEVAFLLYKMIQSLQK